MKKLSILLIILGILIAGIPIYDRAYTWYWQSKVLESYENLDTVFLEEPENITPEPIALTPIESTLPENSETKPDVSIEYVPEDTTTPPPTTQATQVANLPQAIGILKISKINLKLPIFNGATKGNMKIGVGWMKETTPIGENGNAGLAAHRSHTYGRFFNRLDEIEIDDTFTITVGNETYKYVVYNKIVVEPDDISVLNRSKNNQIITLITCTPLITASHRLIIQAKLY